MKEPISDLSNLNNQNKENLKQTNDVQTQITDKFLMPFRNFDLHYRHGVMTIEKKRFLEELDQKIDSLVGQYKPAIFDKIKKARAEGQDINSYLENNEKLLELAAPLKSRLIDLPDNLLGELLKPLDREVRQTLYVQRDTMTLETALAVYRKKVKKSRPVFHVSKYDIENYLEAGKTGPDIYFSTNIKKLFNLKEAKYIYLMTLNEDELDKYKYGATEFFGKIALPKGGKMEILDKIKIFDDKDPSYRQKTLTELGAEFDQDYVAADDHGARFMRDLNDNDILAAS